MLRGDRFATETDRKPYAFGAKFGRPYSDVYVVDVKSGERRKALEKVRFFYGASATGRKLAWYDGKDYWTHGCGDGRANEPHGESLGEVQRSTTTTIPAT